MAASCPHKHDWVLHVPASFTCACGQSCEAVPLAEYVPKTPVTLDDPGALSTLALATVQDLRSRIGIDIACVFLSRAGDGKLGVSIDGGQLPIDTVAVQIIEGLVLVRNAIVKAAVAKAKDSE